MVYVVDWVAGKRSVWLGVNNPKYVHAELREE